MASTDIKKQEGIIIPIIKEVDSKPLETKPLIIKTDNYQNNVKPGSSTIILPPLPFNPMANANMGATTQNKKSVKILPKPASLGFSIGNIVTNLTGNSGQGGASTYFIVTNLPNPIGGSIPNNMLSIATDTNPVRPKERYDCSDCDLSFAFKGSLSEHVRQEHRRKDVFQCEFCDKEFRRKHLLQSHIKFRHNKVNYQKCPKCDEEFQSNKLLNSHIEKEHKEKYYTCPECDLEFNLRNTLMNHIKSEHRKDKAFQCDQCDARYSWKKSLNLHIDSTHKNLPQFKCNQCTSIFRWKTSLVHHLKAAHKTEEVSKHPCADCTLSFNSERKLNVHRKKIHKDKFAVPRTRKAGRSRGPHFRKRDATGGTVADSDSDSDSSEDEIPKPLHIDHMEIVDPSDKYTLPDVGSLNNGHHPHVPISSSNNGSSGGALNATSYSELGDRFNLTLPPHTSSSPIQPSNVNDQPTPQNDFNSSSSSLAPTNSFASSFNPYFSSWK